MQSTLLSPARRYPSSLVAQRPVVTRHSSSPRHPSSLKAPSYSESSPFPMAPKMEHLPHQEADLVAKPSSPEAEKILRNSLYLTFNAPQVDDYHRGLFLTHPPRNEIPDRFSGTLFHASYPSADLITGIQTWVMDERAVKDVTSSQTLVLLYRICTFSDSSSYSVDDQYAAVRAILETIPLGRDNREAQLGALAPEQGNPVLAGYDCIIWVVDALQTLAEAGIFRVEDLNMQSAEQIMSTARALAGPADARTAVGVDFGGLRVVN